MGHHIPKVAVWGLGKHALKNIIPALDTCSAVELIGVFSRKRQVVDYCVKEYGCKFWISEEDLLKDPEVDVVYVSTPIGLHYEQGIKILNARKHFWCEKPLCSNYAEAKELVNLGIEIGKSVLEGFMYLYHPQFQFLKEAIQNKQFGDLKSVNCRFGLPFLDSPGFRDKPELGGSCLLDVGCYPLSAVLELLSDHEPTLKIARINKIEGYAVDMEGWAILKFPSDTTAFLEWGMGRAYRNDIDIWGTEGSVYTDRIFSKSTQYEPIIEYRTVHGKKEEIRINSDNHFVSMFDHFSNLLVGMDSDIIADENRRMLRRMNYLEQIRNVKNSQINKNL